MILSCTFFWMWSALWFLSSSVSFFRGRVFTPCVSFCPLSIGGIFYERLICSLVPVSSLSSVSLIHIVERKLEVWHLSLQCVVWCVLWIVELALIIDYLQRKSASEYIRSFLPLFLSLHLVVDWHGGARIGIVLANVTYLNPSISAKTKNKAILKYLWRPSFHVPQSIFNSITRPVGWPCVQILLASLLILYIKISDHPCPCFLTVTSV